jgi:hypothetical protein
MSKIDQFNDHTYVGADYFEYMRQVEKAMSGDIALVLTPATPGSSAAAVAVSSAAAIAVSSASSPITSTVAPVPSVATVTAKQSDEGWVEVRPRKGKARNRCTTFVCCVVAEWFI